jgi:type I restriction enzyme S subunit
MQVKSIPSRWIYKEGLRLDSNPYMSGVLEAKMLLDRLSVPKVKLQDLTFKGMEGIFHAGREGRTWVDNPQYGTPFMNGRDILASDLSYLPLLSNKQIKSNPKLLIEDQWILITRSGTIGRMSFSRAEMGGLACTEDVLRVVPDKNLVHPGYLYAYLISQFGIPLVTSGTYGAIIQHIEPHHVGSIPVLH